MSLPFIIFGLPRSRTTWLSRFLSYGDWICGHDELRHMRSMSDVSAWFSQPFCGTVETSGAVWWRLLDRFAPDARVILIRRPVADVVESMMRLPKVEFDREDLARAMTMADRKLDQVAARLPRALSFTFDELRQESVCAQIFEHCLPYAHDRAHWWMLHDRKVETDFYALTRYAQAYRPAMERLARIAKHETLSEMSSQSVEPHEGITFQTEDFQTWLRDAEGLIDDHLMLVGEAPGDWRCKNLELMTNIDRMGNMQILTARSNGRMFGYLMTLINPSLTSPTVISGTHTTFYADPEMPRLGIQIMREANQRLKDRGVSEAFMEAGLRGSGPRIGSLFRRIGAQPHGEVYRLQL